MLGLITTIAFIFGPLVTYLLFYNNGFRKITTAMYLFVKHKEVKFFILNIVKFFINVGASVSSISVVAIFIPLKDIEIGTIVIVWFCGIIIAILGYYAERSLRANLSR